MKSSIRISPGWNGSIMSVSVVVDEFDIFCTSACIQERRQPTFFTTLDFSCIRPKPGTAASMS